MDLRIQTIRPVYARYKTKLGEKGGTILLGDVEGIAVFPCDQWEFIDNSLLRINDTLASFFHILVWGGF